MSVLLPAPGTGPPTMSPAGTSPSSRPSKRQRILACELCQKRKVKCDRQFPCANCVKSHSQCVPGTVAPRQRRRRYTESALMERIRKYEDLLRQNNVTFEPVHSTRREGLHAGSDDESHDELMDDAGPDVSASSTTAKSESGYGAKSVFHTMSQGFRDHGHDSDSSHDDLRETTVRRALDSAIENDRDFLFGPHGNIEDLTILHPDPVQIFRLWQVYMDNVNPMLKVTHIPSLQPRVIEAASNLTTISSNLEALMFGIYCTAVSSLKVDDCQTMFGTSKEELLSRYQSGCQQALWKCNFLRNNDRECLTALFLYLISVKSSTAPQSLSSMLGVAIRIAQRMALNRESALAARKPFDAEMGRRLWWSLMLFDTRMAELAGFSTVTLDPTWDCKIPLNANDSDLRLDMKVPPPARKEPTDAIFAVLRGELADFIRHTSIHLEFANPALKPIAKHASTNLASDGSSLAKLEEMIESRYLKACDQENPVQFIAAWTVRAQLAKYQLLEHNLRLSASSTRRVDADYDVATAYALRVLECDTKVMTSPLTKGFIWWNQMNFPFPAYYQIAQDLRRRPTCKKAQQGWNTMSDNWMSWLETSFSLQSPVFRLFTKIILPAWEAYENTSKPPGPTIATPKIVVSMRAAQMQMAEMVQNAGLEGSSGIAELETNDLPTSTSMPVPMTMPSPFPTQNLPYEMGMQNSYAWMTPGMSPMPGGGPVHSPLDNSMIQLDWGSFGGWPRW